MSDPRLSSPSSIRVVAAAAAAVASLGVVALGVQLGTSGLVGDGPGRNPGATTATPASATVDLPRRPTLAQLAIALAPELGASTFGSPPATAAVTTPAAPTATPPAPTAPGGGGANPAPAPTPSPGPVPAPPITAPVPIPAPVPTPTIPPALDPIVEPIGDVVDDLGVVPQGADSSTPVPPSTPLDGLMDLLLNP